MAATTGFSARDIVTYYDHCEVDYRLAWDLDRSLAMHIGFWDERTRTLRQALARQNEIMAEQAVVEASDVVLDAGCGVGGSAIFLAERYGCRVLGITLSRVQAARARGHASSRQVSERTEFTVMDYTRTAFADGRFTLVWALESVCYAADKSAFVREAARLLAPGGRLVLADGFATKPVREYSPEESRLMRLCLHNWAVVGVDSKEDFEGYFTTAGLVTESYREITPGILPSTRRLRLRSLVGYPLAKVGELLGLRTPVQTANILGARYPHVLCRRGLIRYGIFVARKPSA